MNKLLSWVWTEDFTSLRREKGIFRAICLLSLLGIGIFTALFLCTLWKTSGFAQVLSVIASYLLFVLLGLRFVPVWVRAWATGRSLPLQRDGLSDGGSAACGSAACGSAADRTADFPDRRTRCRDILCILLCFLLAGAAQYLLLHLLRLLTGHRETLLASMRLSLLTDGQHYLDIANFGYRQTYPECLQIVFFPLYPLCIRALRLLLGSDFASALVLSFLCFASSGVTLYSLLLLDHDRKTVLRALLCLLLFPGAYFFFFPLTESLFLLLSTLCFLFLRKERFFPACLFAGLAVLTRSMGLCLLAPLLFARIMFFVRRRERRIGVIALRLLPLLLPLFCFGLYLACNVQLGGDPFLFLRYQKENWSQQMDIFFHTAAYLMDYACRDFSGGEWARLLGLRLPQLLALFLNLAVMVPKIRKLHPVTTCYFIAAYLFTMGATWLLSAPRYMTVLFMLPQALALQKRKGVTFCILALFSVSYLLFYALRWYIW